MGQAEKIRLLKATPKYPKYWDAKKEKDGKYYEIVRFYEGIYE